MTQASAVSGLSLGLAIVLTLAAIKKLRALTSFEVTLVRLLPRAVWSVPGLHSRRLSRLVVVTELLTGGALLVASDSFAVAVVAWTTALFAAFLLALVVASRRGLSCGCLGRAHGSVGRSGVARGTALLVVSVSLLASVALGDPAGNPRWHVALMVAASVTVVAFAPGLGLRLRPFFTTKRYLSAPGVEPGGHGISRRSLLVRSGALVALVLLGPRLGGTELALANGSCDSLGDACIVCCRNNGYGTSCTDCCDLCFARCGTSRPCPQDSCFGPCWDPDTTH